MNCSSSSYFISPNMSSKEASSSAKSVFRRTLEAVSSSSSVAAAACSSAVVPNKSFPPLFMSFIKSYECLTLALVAVLSAQVRSSNDMPKNGSPKVLTSSSFLSTTISASSRPARPPSSFDILAVGICPFCESPSSFLIILFALYHIPKMAMAKSAAPTPIPIKAPVLKPPSVGTGNCSPPLSILLFPSASSTRVMVLRIGSSEASNSNR
mmetsp:Transcript_9786/g.23053  ORF Transcript_9786/g.23053 Transcript_9786/m.23053 type:complete len:210 (+) Transcript_9786:280-909(+)